MKMRQFSLPFCFFLCFQSAFLVAQKVITLPKWQVKPLELTVLNSAYRDVNISITPNGKYLYFMSGRGGMPWSTPNYTSYRGKPEFDGDIWYSQKDANGDWEKPLCVNYPICTSSGEDEPNISADGQTVYFQSWAAGWQELGGPYYRAELHGDKWGKPVGLGGGINQFFQNGHTATDGMSVSPDGKTFVVACGNAYDGAMDIYISRKNEKGIWSFLEKLSISTPADDRSVFIGADNKTLYFGSAGWGGFGKLDIFKTTIEEGTKCGAIYNIGQPFNTAEEDYGFVMDIVRNDVYFVRNSDIYYAHLGEVVADNRIQAAPVVIVDGTVKDEMGKGVESEINLLNNENQLVAHSRSNAITGEYSLSFPRKEGEYTQQIRFNENYKIEKNITIDPNTKQVIEQPILAESQKIAAPKPAIVVAKKVEEPVPVKVEEKMATPKAVVETAIHKTIYFDFDKDVLNSEAQAELLALIQKAQASKNYTLQITGHTDAVGSNAYNQLLSEKRTNQAVNFLKAQNTPLSIVTIFSKGETEPAVENDSKEHRAMNRRVEIVLILKQ